MSSGENSPVYIADIYNMDNESPPNALAPLMQPPPHNVAPAASRIRVEARSRLALTPVLAANTDISRPSVNRRLVYDYNPSDMAELIANYERAIREQDSAINVALRIRDIFQYLFDSNLDGNIADYEVRRYTDMGNDIVKQSRDEVLKRLIIDALAKMQMARVAPPPPPPPPPSPRHLPEKRRRVLNTVFFDVISRDDVRVNDFLHENALAEQRPFIISHNREFIGNYVLPEKEIFYECAPNATEDRPNKRHDSKTFVKLIGAGGATILCIRPRWFDNPTHTSIIVRAKKEGQVAQIISKTCQDRPQGSRRLVSADHCNLTAPLDYYKLVPYTQKSRRSGRTKRTRGSPNTRRIRNETRRAFYAEKARKQREKAQDNMLKNTPSLSSSPIPVINNFFPSRS
jgi:hypothetical protein